jgi:hypothetical protein
MTGVICKSGTPEAGKTTVTLERGKTLIVFSPGTGQDLP